jgi:hypothetical protein
LNANPAGFKPVNPVELKSTFGIKKGMNAEEQLDWDGVFVHDGWSDIRGMISNGIVQAHKKAVKHNKAVKEIMDKNKGMSKEDAEKLLAQKEEAARKAAEEAKRKKAELAKKQKEAVEFLLKLDKMDDKLVMTG